MAEIKVRACKDCSSITRKLPYPGPRCTTCHRARKKMLRAKAQENRATGQYGLRAGEYDLIKESQGGTCAILNCKAKGITRALAIDHDHACCKEPPLCGDCVRGLLCVTHNEWLGRAGDDPEVFRSLAAYLENPPAQKLLKELRNGQNEQNNS